MIKIPVRVNGGTDVIKEYRFGDPRSETAPAYRIVEKMIAGLPLISYAHEEGKRVDLVSPLPFFRSPEINTIPGGSYAIADLRDPQLIRN